MTSLPTPRFTVVVPTHGRAELLQAALRSVLAQTVQDFEVIVVVDGESAGQSPPIGVADRRIRVLAQPHRGAGGARNAGIRAAVGQYVTFLDDDDEFTPDRLELAERGLAIAPIALCWKAGLVQRDVRWRRVLNGDVGTVLLEEPVPQMGSAAIRRDLVLEMDESLPVSEDVEWWLRMSTQAPVCTVTEVGYLIRDHHGPRLTSRVVARRDARLQILRMHEGYFRSRPRAAAYHWRRAAGLASITGRRWLAYRCHVRSVMCLLRALLHRG